jgi:hypothetical protein
LSKGKIAEEVIEFYTDYLKGVESIGIPESRHEGRLTGVGTVGKDSFSPGQQRREQAHLKVLQQLAEVGPYMDIHKAELQEQIT